MFVKCGVLYTLTWYTAVVIWYSKFSFPYGYCQIFANFAAFTTSQVTAFIKYLIDSFDLYITG